MTPVAPIDPVFERVAADPVYQGRVFTVLEEQYRSPDGEVFHRQIVRNPGAVAVIPLHDDGTVTLIRQYRPALGRSIWEIPAGLLDKPGESLHEAAARELREEVGLAGTTWEQLLTFAPAPGMTDEVITLFLAQGLSDVGREADGAEERHLHIERLPFADAIAMVHRGDFEDGKSVVGLLLVAARQGLDPAAG